MNMEIGTTAKVRELNQEVVLAALRQCESASIADLAKQVDLSIATCMKIVGGLVEGGEIEEIGERESRGGRPAKHYRFNSTHSVIAALILQKTEAKEFILSFVADANGHIMHSDRTDTGTLDAAAVDGLLNRLKKDYPALKAVSLSVPGTVTDGVIGPAEAPSLTGLRIEDHIRTQHGLVASVENDMNFAALGYYKCHLADGQSDLAYLLFPRGGSAGGGLMINDKLVRGKSGFAGELSYMAPSPQRDKIWRILAKPNAGREYVEYAAGTVRAVAALINPGVVVLSGEGMTGGMKDAILAACAQDIPEEHLPELVIKPDYSDDCLTGMIVQAVSSLARYPHLLQFSPVNLFHYRTAE